MKPTLTPAQRKVLLEMLDECRIFESMVPLSKANKIRLSALTKAIEICDYVEGL